MKTQKQNPKIITGIMTKYQNKIIASQKNNYTHPKKHKERKETEKWVRKIWIPLGWYYDRPPSTGLVCTVQIPLYISFEKCKLITISSSFS